MTEMPINNSSPLLMHIDLNSAYAMIEQQANPLIRHKPVAIAAYDTPRGAIIASSYEAKAKNIKLGLNVKQAKIIDPNVIILTPDPEKYFYIHRKLRKILLQYTSDITPKSIDEFVIDLNGSPSLRQKFSMQEIGLDIKKKIKQELGEYFTVNIGIGTNRFLAKLAAGLNKPDGLNTIDINNLEKTYEKLSLIDLPGINVRYEARLNRAKIFTPIQFLNANVEILKKQVFKSIVGYYWYLRLRGHEIDKSKTSIKSFSQQYALHNQTSNREELSRLIMKLSEKVGRRLRKHGLIAFGVHLSLDFKGYSYWAKGNKQINEIYSTQDIYSAALLLLDKAVIPKNVIRISLSIYNLRKYSLEQMDIFHQSRLSKKGLAVACDNINNKYGEFTIVPTLMANMNDVIIKRVPFGSVRDIE